MEKIYEHIEDGTMQCMSLNTAMIRYIHKLRKEYRLSLADCECIIVCKDLRDILLTDDTYLAKIAIKEGIKNVYDLKDILGGKHHKKLIKNSEELSEIILLLKKKDYYEVTENTTRYLFSLFEE